MSKRKDDDALQSKTSSSAAAPAATQEEMHHANITPDLALQLIISFAKDMWDIEKLKLLSADEYAKILFDALTDPKNEKSDINLYKFFSLYEEGEKMAEAESQASAGAAMAATEQKTEISSAKHKLLSFLYFLTFEYLKETNNPWANYYCKLAHQHDLSPDYASEETYEYARAFEAEGGFIPKSAQRANFIYNKIMQTSSKQAGFAKMKWVLKQSRTFKEMRQGLTEINSMDKNLDPFIKAEISFIELCDYAKEFKSKDQKLQNILSYLQAVAIIKYPSLKEYSLSQDQLKEIPSEASGKNYLMILMSAVEGNRILKSDEGSGNLGWLPDTISSNDVNRALLIYYTQHPEDAASTPHKRRMWKTYLLKSAVTNDPDVLWDLSENYKNYYQDLSDPTKNSGDDLFDKQYERYIKNFGQTTPFEGSDEQRFKAAQIRFLEKAACHANVEAQYEISQHYLNLCEESISCEQNKARQQYFLTLAADAGYTKAQYDLAVELEEGRMLSDEHSKAHIIYYAMAAKKNAKALEKYTELLKPISQNLLKISIEDFELLKKLGLFDVSAAMCVARCYSIGSTILLKKNSKADLTKKAIGLYEALSSLDANATIELICLKGDRNLLRKVITSPDSQELKDLQNILDDKEEIASKKQIILAFGINDLLTGLNKQEKIKIKTIIESTKRIVFTAANAPNAIAKAKMRYAFFLLEGNEQDCKKKAFILLLDAANGDLSAEENNMLLEKITKLLETPNIIQESRLSYQQIEKLIALDLKSKTRGEAEFIFAQRILEVLENNYVAEESGAAAAVAKTPDQQYSEEEKLALQKQVTRLLLLGTDNNIDRARDLLVFKFCEKKCDLTFEKIQEIRKWKSVRKKYHNAIAKRLFEIGNLSENKAEKERYQEEFTCYFNDSSNKNELEVACSDWIVRNTKVKNIPTQQPSKEDLGASYDGKTAASNAITGTSVDESDSAIGDSVMDDASNNESRESSVSDQSAGSPVYKRTKKKEKILSKQELKRIKNASSEPKIRSQATPSPSTTKSDSSSVPTTPDLPLSPPYIASAASFAGAAKMESSVEKDRRGMGVFLASVIKITTLSSLPEFLATRLDKIHQKKYGPKDNDRKCQIMFKGSKVYQSPKNKRVPSDLDIEILIPEMSKWKDSEIEDFIRENFGSANVPKIFRSRGEFTVSFEDKERKIDASFYDLDKQPQAQLGWTTSRERKLLLTDGGFFEEINPRGFDGYMAEKNIQSFNSKKDFYINPNSRGLVLRMCFLQTIGVIFKEEMIAAIERDLTKNPIDLLFRELKIDLALGRGFYQSEIEEKAQKNIKTFMEKHFQEPELQSAFLANLSCMANLEIHGKSHEPEFRPIKKAIGSMLGKPSANILARGAAAAEKVTTNHFI